MNTKLKQKYTLSKKEVRIYSINNSCVFKKNNDKYGGLSNMATGYPIILNDLRIPTSEALYQCCKFTHLPDLQLKIIEQKSPMKVKMISNANKKNNRDDWESIRINAMKWCLQMKLAQNFVKFGSILNETGLLNIVENSSRDNFWGAIPDETGKKFIGKNALGRLLMELRQTYYSYDKYSLLIVKPPKNITNFSFIESPIEVIDERKNFIAFLEKYWKNNYTEGVQSSLFHKK